MTEHFDHEAMNHQVVALSRQFSRASRDAVAEGDTLFLGGAAPGRDERVALSKFAMHKNYNIVFASFDVSNVSGGPTAIDAVVTNGVDQSRLLLGGRLWKRRRGDAAVLVFEKLGVTIGLNAQCRLVVRRKQARLDMRGYEAARDDLAACVAGRPGSLPVVSPIGGLITVMDMQALAGAFAMAA